MGGRSVGKKETCHRPHGVLITITLEGEPKRMVIVHEKDPTTPPPSKLAPKPQKRPFGMISYIWSGAQTNRF